MHRLFDFIGGRLTGRSDFTAQYHRYMETIQWLAGELLRFDSSSTIKSVIFNVMGGVLKAGSLAFLLYYASLMEGGGSLDLLGYNLEYRSEPVFYLAMSVALLLLVCGALVAYAGNHIVNNLSVAFASHCSQRVIRSSGRRPFGNPDPSLAAYPASVPGNVTCVILLSRPVKKLLRATNPFATLVYSLAVLFYLNAALSFVVVAIALSTLFLQYVVNYQSAQNEKIFNASRTKGIHKLIRLLANNAMTPKMFPGAVRRLEYEYEHSVIGEFLQSYYQRMMAPTKSALVSDLLLAALSFLIVILLGRNALLGNTSWAHFLGYLMFARIVLLSFRGVLVSITGFARHYMRARKMYEYLRPATCSTDSLEEAIDVVSQGNDCIGDRKRTRMQLARPLMIISPVPLSRFNLYAFADALAGGSRNLGNALCDSMVCISKGFSSYPGGSLNELLSIPEQADDEVVSARLHAVGLAREVSRDIPLTRKEWRQLPGRTRALILLQYERQQAADLLLVDNDLLMSVDADNVSRWIREHADSKVGIVSSDLQALKDYDGKFVVLMAQDRSVSIASKKWCEENCAVIEGWFASHAVNDAADDTDDGLLEDE